MTKIDIDTAKAAYYAAETAKINAAVKELQDEDRYAEYFFFAEIDSVSVAKVAASMNRQFYSDPDRDFTLIFNSPGGVVHAGLGFYDFVVGLRNKGARVKTKVNGVAASLAAVLTQVGDERTISPHSFLMIHEVTSGAYGNVRDIEARRKEMARFEEHALDILCERSKLTKARIKRRLKTTDNDWYLDASEALELGLVDAIEP